MTKPHLKRTRLAQLFSLGSSTLLLACAFSVEAQVAGAGSTLVRELMTGWTAQYGAASGGVTYEAIGSSAGVASP